MELYIKVSFWCGVIVLLINLGALSFATFPIEVKQSLGLKVVQTLVGAGVTLWAGTLLYAS